MRMGIVPGEEPAERTGPPILNEDPVPPGVEDLRDDVDEIEQRVRRSGPEEVERADRAADAVEGEEDRGEGDDGEDDDAAEEVGSDDAGSASDAANDPTSDDPSTDVPA